MKNRKWSAEQVLVAVCCCNWKTNDMTWHGDILNRYGNYKELYYIIYIYILCFRYFGGWTPMNIHIPAIWMFSWLPGFWPMMWFEWVDLTTCTLLWRLPVPFACTASIGCRFQTLCVKNRALCWTRGPFNSFADTNCNRFRTDTLQGGYGYTSQPFRKSWHGIVQVYSISQFWTICHWCFVFEPRAPQVFRIELVCCTFCSKWYCYFPTPWGISNHTTAWCLHNFRLLPSAILFQRHGRAQRAVRTEFDRAEQWAARGFTRH